MKVFPTSFLLGLAGIDPTGAIVIISALAMGVKKSKIILFILTVFFGTVLVGLVSSNLVLDTVITQISNLFNAIPNYIYMILEFIIGLVLLHWFIKRVFLNKPKETDSIFTKYIKKGLFFVGIIFSIFALADPSFLALITLTGQNANILENVLANIAWVLISQFPIFILLIAIIFNKHEKLINWYNEKLATSKKIKTIKKILSITLSTIILITSLLTLAEAIYYFFTNTWLF